MSAHSNYESSVKNAGPVAVQALLVAANTLQETISNVGAGPGGGSSTATGVTLAQDATIRKAAVTYQVAQQAAQVARAATEDVAKATLRATGDRDVF